MTDADNDGSEGRVSTVTQPLPPSPSSPTSDDVPLNIHREAKRQIPEDDVEDSDDDDEPIIRKSGLRKRSSMSVRNRRLKSDDDFEAGPEDSNVDTVTSAETPSSRRKRTVGNGSHYRGQAQENSPPSGVTTRNGKVRRKNGRRQTNSSDDEDGHDEIPNSLVSSDDAGEQLFLSTSTRERTEKRKLIAQVLSRWWYVLPPWPPENFNFDEELEKRKLKRMGFDQWEEADDVDENGFRKVYEISYFPGISAISII